MCLKVETKLAVDHRCLPLTPITTLVDDTCCVMNLVPTHSNCTSPMDYISHHALHSHIPVHHYTNHTAVTIHSSLWLPHHTCTSFSHSHKSSTQTLTQCEVLFSPGYISERSPILLLSLCFTPGLPDLGSLNLCLWPRLLPGIVYVSALPLIFLFLPADLACLICILNIAASGSTRLWPFLTEDFAIQGSRTFQIIIS